MIDAQTLFAVGFSIWAGVVGLGVRLVFTRLADVDRRLGEIEKAVVKLNTLQDLE